MLFSYTTLFRSPQLGRLGYPHRHLSGRSIQQDRFASTINRHKAVFSNRNKHLFIVQYLRRVFRVVFDVEQTVRSEERRVGKECGSRGAPSRGTERERRGKRTGGA